MRLKMMISGEFFSTNVAAERFLAGMRPLMILKDMLIAETFVASLTGELATCSSGASATAGISGCHLVAVRSFGFSHNKAEKGANALND